MTITKNALVTLIILVIVAAAAGGYYLWQQKTAGKGVKEGEKSAQGPVQYT